MSSYDDELIQSLGRVLPTDRYEVIVGDQDVFDEIGKHYPAIFSTVNWSLVEHKSEIFVPPDISTAAQLEILNGFFGRLIGTSPALDAEVVMIVGDGLTDHTYRTRFSDFRDQLSKFLEVPQHLFVWFRNPKKLLHIKMEGDVYFG